MSWMDDEMDDLFREHAGDHSIPYKNDYWKEFEEEYLDKRRGEGLWYITAIFFIGCLLVGHMLPENITETMDVSSMNSYAQNDVVADNRVATNGLSNSDKSGDQQVIIDKMTHGSQPTLNFVLGSENSVRDQSVLTGSANIDEIVVAQDINGMTFKTDEIQVEAKEKTEFEFASFDNQFEKLEYRNANLEEVVINNPILPLKSYNVPRFFRYYMEGTMGVTQSMIKGNGLASHNYGIGFGTKFSKGRFVATLGVNGSIANHNEMLLTRSSKIYGFGSNEYKADIDYAQLYHVGLNASAGARIGLTTLSLGFGINYVASTKSYVYQYTIDSQNPDDAVYKRNTYYNYMDGLNRFTTTASLGIAREFSPGIEMGLNLGIQLNNNFNSTVTTELNTAPLKGQLFIRKTF